MILCSSQMLCFAKRKDFEGQDRTVVYKGEHIVGLGISYFGLNTNNSDILTLVTNLNASAQYFNLAPFYGFAYARNQYAGVRVSYSNIRGGAESMDVNLLGLMSMDDISFDVNSRSFGASIFNRSFIGLDKKGNVGLYCEVALGYKNSHTSAGSYDKYTQGNNFRLSVSPGVILYIVPNASLNVQFGILHADFKKSVCYDGCDITGSMKKFNAGINLSIMDLSFGVNYHF